MNHKVLGRGTQPFGDAMTAPASIDNSEPGKSEVEKTTAALVAATRKEGMDPALRSSMLALAARLSAHHPDANSPAEVAALGADLQAARSALSWSQYKEATLSYVAERKRDIERQSTRQALQQFVDRKAKFYLWVLLAVAGFLVFLIVGNLVLSRG